MTLPVSQSMALQRQVVEAMYEPIDEVCRVVRPITEFAEQEVVLPEGSALRSGRRYSYSAMPFKRLVHQELDNPRWKRKFLSGPSQVGGKTLDLIIALMYSLFEKRHPCALSGPDVDMIQSVVWEPKIKPVLMSSRYRDLFPKRGQGSRDGKFRALHFRNGAHLYFLGAGGSDSQRTSLTVKDLFCTELDQLAQRSDASVESSPFKSMEDRTRAFPDASIYGECVTHDKGGLIWQETETTLDGKPTGSGGRIFVLCPHCRKWLWPVREGLVGWQDAETELQARKAAGYACSECGAIWSEADREKSCLAPRLVHRGQEVRGEGGTVVGELPETRTLGIRWNCMHSPLVTMAAIAADEWNAANTGKEAEERNVCNNVWNEPWDPEASESTGGRVLTSNAVREKVGDFDYRVVPAAAEVVTMGIDVGEYLCSWMLPAWKKDATGWLVDAGEIFVPSGASSPKVAVEAALSQFLAKMIETGWPVEATGAKRLPDLTFIDSGYFPDVVHSVCRTFTGRGLKIYPSKGWGSTGRRSPFRAPNETTEKHEKGNEWFTTQQDDGQLLVNINVDHWKREVQRGLLTPVVNKEGQPVAGAFVLWKPTGRMEHMATAKALVSEVWQSYIHKTKGMISGWKVQSPTRTHRLDAMGYAACAADICGVKLLAAPAPAKPAPAQENRPPVRVESTGRRQFRTKY